MNWMRASLRKQGWTTLLLGAAAGIWAAFLAESAGVGAGQLGIGMGGQVLAAALMMGLASGALLAPIGESLHRHRRRAWLAAGWGALCGTLAGGLGVGVFTWWATPRLLVRGTLLGFPLAHLYGAVLPVLLAMLGGAIGLASGFGAGKAGVALRRLRSGLAGGLIGGLALGAVVILLPLYHWAIWGGLVFWGAVVAGTIFWTEKRFARRWLRLLSGPGEDEYYPLVDTSISLGKLESNDIPLRHYSEVYPVHCRIEWAEGQYKIIDDESGGTVYVNFRQVQEQPLKSGDLVKIGSALLQYGEAS